jgi:hypothetical protein
MDILSFFKNTNIILSPFVSLLTVVNTFILVMSVVKDKLFKDDNFCLEVTKQGNITFYNKGKYTIEITEIAIWADDGAEIAPKLENLHPEKFKIAGRDKRNFYIPLNKKEFREISSKYHTIYLCFDIESDSGIVYQQLSYPLLNKNGSLILGKSKLNKELCFRK